MIIFDTNVVSYLFSGDDRGHYYLERSRDRRAVISFQTLEEIWYGAYAKSWDVTRMKELARHLDQYEVVWPSPRLADVCARLRSERKLAGREMQSADAWIAATVIMLGCPLASHDRDFVGIPSLELLQAPVT